VNGQSLLGCSHQDAVNALRSVGADLSISVCDGFDPSVLGSLEAAGSANRNSVIRLNSQSSIDRDSADVCDVFIVVLFLVSPSPPVDCIRAVLVWRVRGRLSELFHAVLCTTVMHDDTHTCEQFLAHCSLSTQQAEHSCYRTFAWTICLSVGLSTKCIVAKWLTGSGCHLGW